MKDPYYSRPEVSNSDLTELKKYWQPEQYVIDIEQAYKFGSLLDAVITEPHLVNYYKLTAGDVQHSQEDFQKAEQMKIMFFKDPLCFHLAKQSLMQKVSVKQQFHIAHDGFDFTLPVRCKFDFFVEGIDMSGDLKSTACTSQKQFEASIHHFDYDRQAAWYLDLEGRSNFIFIGISKVNFKIFKIPVKKGSEIYNQGKAKYQDLAFKYWYLFSNINNTFNN